MNFDIITKVNYLNMDFGAVLLNILGIVGLIVVGGFIITFLADFLIYIIDNKNGIFFKRKEDKESEKLPARPKLLQEPVREPLKEDDYVVEPSVDEQIEQLTANNKVDFEKALQEEEELRKKLAMNNEGVISEQEVESEDFDIEAEINKLKQKEEEYKLEKTQELEARNKAIAEANKIKTNENEVVLNSEDDIEDIFDEMEDDIEMGDFDEEFQKIIDSLNNKDVDKEALGIVDDEDAVQLPLFTEEDEKKDVVEENIEGQKVVEEPIVAQNIQETEVSQDVQEELEEQRVDADKQALEQEIAKLKAELEQEREILRQERVSAMERAANLEGEKERLEKELENAKNQAVINAEITPALLTKSEYLNRLEVLHQRLQENEKQMRQTKKEFKPLQRVKNTLERDKQKLRRREAIVAKQKVMLYGVNNFVDIDEEKAQKLAEDLDLLDGLRMSVQHCEEVMEANKDRYPILEQTYNILDKNNTQIKQDIEDAEQALKQLEENE